jgi:hypothetical protein
MATISHYSRQKFEEHQEKHTKVKREATSCGSEFSTHTYEEEAGVE